MNEVTGALINWGAERIKLYEHSGYSPESVFARIFQGQAGKPSHRILCADLTGRAWRIEIIVMHLEPIYRDALLAKFAIPPKPDGTLYSNREMAGKLNISRHAYLMRIRRAKKLFREELKRKKTLDLSHVSRDKIPASNNSPERC